MIRNIIFDFGAVLVDWNPEYLYGPYFKDNDRMKHFLTEICPHSWNAQADAGRSTAEITEERVAMYPEWEKEIRMYFSHWVDMMGGEIPGMEETVAALKQRGYKLYGLTNWSAETFPLVRSRYPVFELLDGIVVSGEEKIAKPDHEIYRILLRRYELKAEECIFIDDNPANVKSAEDLGIHGFCRGAEAEAGGSSARIVSHARTSSPGATSSFESRGRKTSMREPNLMMPHCSPAFACFTLSA